MVYVKEIPQNFLEGLVEGMKAIIQVRWYPGQDLNSASPIQTAGWIPIML
jgi:hypothetical protein